MDTDIALERMTEVFTPGTLQQKHAQLSLVLASGDSMLFDGDVAWKVVIPASDQILKGNAESLDEACAMMKATLAEIMKTLNPATKVTLAVTEKTA